MTKKYKCSFCRREFYREDVAKKCTHGKFAAAIVQNRKEHELKDIRLLKDKTEIEKARRIMAARKALERALSFGEE